MFKRFIRDSRGIAGVAVIAIITVPLTFMVWLLSWTPIQMFLDIIEPLTTDQNALNIYAEAHTVAGALLVVEVVVIIVWWLASSFRREDQTYRRRSYGY